MPAPAKLSQETILLEAIALLREEGLDEVTLRKLAARLGVEAPSLYRHIGGKPRLLALMTLRLFRLQIDKVGCQPNWQAWLIEFGRILWNTQLEIDDCARLVLTAEFEPRQFDTMTEWVAEALAPYGIEAESALEMQLAVQSVILGLAGNLGGPKREYLRRTIPVDRIGEHAVAALVEGWESSRRTVRRVENSGG